MSGGVDSSVAAYLLKKQGYDVTGVFMRCWGGGSPSHSLGITPSSELWVSCAEQDAEDARRVAERLSIPFYVWDFEEEYKKKVVDYMIRGYRQGITPNPDVMCNREIKFGLFLERALKMGADYVATGHYVRLGQKHQVPSTKFQTNPKFKAQNTYQLLQAKDLNKDQSYFLWTLNQKQLARCIFPIGDYLKPKVREIARRAGLQTAEKKDSQGICFLGVVSMEEFLEKYIPKKRGNVLNVKGKKIGEHIGAHFYTIGQRQGLNHESWNMKLASQKGKDRGRFYIARKNIKKNTITVVEGDDNPLLYRSTVRLSDVNIIDPGGLQDSRFKFHVLARVRYRQPLAKAILTFPRGSASSLRLSAVLVFDQPQKFVAEGQSAVFYDKKGVMLGGGIICG